MKTLFWTGKLTIPVKLLVNSNNILAWLTGNSRNKVAMKEHVRLGYEGKLTDHVSRYDEIAGYYQKRSAIAQTENIDFEEKDVIDIGCGTGIIGLIALDRGARDVIFGDISDYMLECAKESVSAHRYDKSHIRFVQLDAESLPFPDESFDIVITGMAFGLFPDQKKAVKEMYRVLRRGGILSLGAHGPEHYWEAADANIRALSKKYLLAYRFEFWPRSEIQIKNLMRKAGLKEVTTNRFIWRNLFSNPVEACDFFASVSSNFWYSRIPENKRPQEYQKTERYFGKKGIRVITDDVIFAYGVK